MNFLLLPTSIFESLLLFKNLPFLRTMLLYLESFNTSSVFYQFSVSSASGKRAGLFFPVSNTKSNNHKRAVVALYNALNGYSVVVLVRGNPCSAGRFFSYSFVVGRELVNDYPPFEAAQSSFSAVPCRKGHPPPWEPETS